MRKGNTMLFVVSLVIFLIGGMGGLTGVHAVDLSGDIRIGYPISADVGNDTLTVVRDPDYRLESNLNADMGKLRVNLGLDVTENLSIDYTLGAEYAVYGPAHVFIEHVEHDMKSGLTDHDITIVGVGLRFD